MIGGAALAPGSLWIEPAVGRGAEPIVDICSGPLQVRLAESRGRHRRRASAALSHLLRKPRRPRGISKPRGGAAISTGSTRSAIICWCSTTAAAGAAGTVVGTYRLIRREAAARLGGFYSAAEYDIAPLVAYPGEILELGRSCVDAAYRQRPAMQLLWSGIAAYVFHYDIALMFGCASLPGTDPETLAAPLSYLHHHHLAPPALRPRALAQRYVDMRRLPAGALDPARALVDLPPLIKGYLRLGGFVGDGAVIDDEFNTTDVCIVVKTDLVSEKYSRHYVRQAKDIKDHMGTERRGRS